jgi:hypothetical protein
MWDFNEKALEEDDEDGREVIVVDTKNTEEGNAGARYVEVENAEVEIEGVEVEEVEEVEAGHAEEAKDLYDGDAPTASIPSSPVLSDLTDDGPLPPTSDGSVELVDKVDDGFGGREGWLGLKRKCSSDVGPEVKSRWKVARREEVVIVSDDESGAGINDDEKRSRSAAASRKLKELVKSGGFVVDEKKRKRFEDKCIEMDGGAKFRYREASWQVLHSKCLKWYTMSEPYNTTKFKNHLGTCKARGERPNLSITSFFKPRDTSGIDAGTKTKIIASGRKQIFIGDRISTSPLTAFPRTDKIMVQSQPCRGISDVHNPLVSTYISRTVVEGAGSISLQKATKMVYGENIKYSELTDDQKMTVNTTQSHLRSWSINRELRVVFSTKCAKFVEQDRSPKTICSNCEKVVSSDAFKRALRVKPATLEKMKFIPAKYRGPLEDLGAKFASTRGLSDLLRDVSSISNPANMSLTATEQDSQTSMWLRFTRGVIKGEYDDNLVFLAMIQATVTAHDRESRGVGLQNMAYLPIYEEFTQMVALTSPRTYRLFAPHIQLPSLRHHR